jgi:TRAP-type mannitol/chloroaromatic compound transport system permease small subunit
VNSWLGCIRRIDALNGWVGRWLAWLTLGMVAACFLTVVLRYAFNLGFIWLQELYVWQYALVFLAGAGPTFLRGGHVRVDVFYASMTARRKAAVDLLGGAIFLLPFLYVVGRESAAFVAFSFAVNESSDQSGGLPALWLLKSGLLAFCALAGLQGAALMARAALILTGRPGDR